MIGEASVGKSSIIRRFDDEIFNEITNRCIGIEFTTKIINVYNKQIKLQIWDTSGQERFGTITRSYYRNASGVFIVYDISDKRSFEQVPKWIDIIKDYANDSNSLNPNIKSIPSIILVGNKTDKSPRAVSYEEGLELAKSHGFLFCETSAKTGDGVKEAFHTLTEKIYSEKLLNGNLVVNESILKKEKKSNKCY